MSPRGVLRKWRTTDRGVHLHSCPELRRLGKWGDSKEYQREHQLLRDLEDGQLEGTRLTNNRTFRRPSKRRNPASIQLCHEQRPKQQTQLSLRGPYTEEAPSQPLQDELYRVDPSLVIKRVGCVRNPAGCWIVERQKRQNRTWSSTDSHLVIDRFARFERKWFWLLSIYFLEWRENTIFLYYEGVPVSKLYNWVIL